MASTTAAPTAKPALPRLISLDVFRGLTMAGMVIVNNPGDWATVYPPLLHAEWHGWTPTDLIFPYFLFIVGVSMTLSKGTLGPWGRILRRAAVIAGLGLFLAGFPYFPLATWRIPGVLQRIAVCYLLGVVIFRATAPAQPEQLLRHALRLAAWTAGLLLAYWAALMWIPVPGGGAGDLSPAGNVGAFVDRTLMGNHLWQRRPWDPEGILSTIPAIGTTLLGIMGGLLLQSKESPRARRCGWSWAERLLSSSAWPGTPSSRSTRTCGRAPTCSSPPVRPPSPLHCATGSSTSLAGKPGANRSRSSG